MATRKGDLTGSKGRQMRIVLNRQVLKAFEKPKINRTCAFVPWKANELVPPRGLAQVTDDCKRVVPITGAADKLC